MAKRVGEIAMVIQEKLNEIINRAVDVVDFNVVHSKEDKGVSEVRNVRRSKARRNRYHALYCRIRRTV